MLRLTKLDLGEPSAIEPPHLRRVQSGYFSKISYPARRQLRIFFESPWEHYKLLRDVAKSNEGALVCHQKALFWLAVVRESHSSSPLQMLEIVSTIRHPNVADIHEAYYHEEKFYVISEYLDLSLPDFDFTQYPLEEWEIATVITEVLEGLRFLCFTLSSNEQIAIDSIRLSLNGEVKLVLDLGYHESSQGDLVEFNIAFVSEIIHKLMSSDERAAGEFWSDEAQDFLSQPLSKHLETSLKHSFLNKAALSKKLIPRIQYMLRAREFLE